MKALQDGCECTRMVSARAAFGAASGVPDAASNLGEIIGALGRAKYMVLPMGAGVYEVCARGTSAGSVIGSDERFDGD